MYKKIIKKINKKNFGSNTEGIKLNIACGNLQLDGYINIDSNEKYKPDLIAKMQDIKFHFENNTITEILVIHAIGYLTYNESINFFNNIKLMLKQGGKLIIETPDLKKIANEIIDRGDEIKPEDIFPIFATSEDGPTHETTYQFSWTESLLEKTLKDVGFTSVIFDTPKTHSARKNRDMRCLAII